MASLYPDFIVGIDVGMTCTGVSYLNRSVGSNTVRWIQRWPGKSDTNENKVPTVVVYDKYNDRLPPTSWGFKSESESERASDNRVYREWFKIKLGPLSVGGGEHDVERWYEDYLRKLYEHIERTVSRELFGASWQSASIEYVFSVPTSWSGPTVENFRRIAKRAGFADDSRPHHSIIMGLTEPEAVAVHTSIEAAGRLSKGDNILVCDAGGGTTDLSILKVSEAQHGSISMQQLLTVCGEDVGSTFIDAEFEKLVTARLAPVEHQLSQSLPEAAWDIMKSRDFQDNKCTFGDHDENINRFLVKIPDLGRSYTDRNSGIESGQMEVKMSDLQKIFDEQVCKITALIDRELERLGREYHPGEQVDHLILSGGLSNSAYVQQQIRKRYGSNASGYLNASAMRIWVAPDPQLAVCKGLVEDRARKLSTGKPILVKRCCRASYGTVCKERYDDKNPMHRGRRVARDPVDGKDYIVDAIEWFIKQGEPVSAEEPVVRPFKMRIAPGAGDRRTYRTSIVVSYGDPKKLPDYMDKSTKKLCDLESDLSTVEEKQFKERNKHLWKRMGGKQHYFECKFEIRVILGAADILFELWFNSQKLSRDKAIQVEWQAETTTSPVSPKSQPAELDGNPVVPAVPALATGRTPSRFLPDFLNLSGYSPRNSGQSAFGQLSPGRSVI